MTDRRTFLKIGGAAALAPAPASPAGVPLDVGSRKQLFIDSRFLARRSGVELNTHPPRKAGTVMVSEKPWERAHIGAYLSVIEDGGTLKMWYMSYSGKGGPHLCYATSTDGLSWQRPVTGVVEFEGSRENNIVMSPFREGAVMLDPVAPPEQRFKTIASFGAKRTAPDGSTRPGSMVVRTSPDGIRWNGEFDVLPFHADSMNTLFWDARIQKYAAYVRGWNPLRVVVRDEIPRDRILGPWPYQRIEQPRYLWSFLKGDWPPAITKELPTVLAAGELDPQYSDIYTPNVQPYPWAQDAYFAFPSLFRHTAPPGSERIPMAGILDAQFAASRDGIRWERYEHKPYIGLGYPGELDSKGIYVGLGLIRRGNEIYQYYGGTAGEHSGGERGGSAVFRTVQRLDGFVSASAGPSGGEAATPLLRFTGRKLVLNVDTSATGVARVEVVGADGRAAPGFEMRNCRPVITNSTAHEVNWENSPDLSRLAGTPVALRFELRNAHLFAFQFTEE